jgi:TetR/AcrR family transcriptional regulator, repressor for uid operon
VPGRSTSREAILAATRQAIVERGPGKLTLSAIAAAAGVSRPTLYRWFPTKTDLLAAIVVYEEEQFDLGLRAAVDAHRSPARRLDAALHYLVTYLDGSLGPDPIGADPQFALQSLARSLPVQVDALVRLLGDAFQQVPAVRSGALSSEGAAELFLRLAYSQYLVPHPTPEVLVANLRRFAGLARGSAVRATG